MRTSGLQHQQKCGCRGPWEAKKAVLPSDTRAAKELGSKTRNKFTAEEGSEGLEQRERFTEKLTDLQKRLSNFIIDTLFNAKRKGKNNFANENN